MSSSHHPQKTPTKPTRTHDNPDPSLVLTSRRKDKVSNKQKENGMIVLLLRNHNSNLHHTCIIVGDQALTDIKQMEKQLKKMKKALKGVGDRNQGV